MDEPVFVAIATAGRRDVLTAMLSELSRQNRVPDVVYIAPAVPEDADEQAISRLKLPVEFVRATPGSCPQRNAILDRLTRLGSGTVTFFDDDFFPAKDYLQEVERLFSTEADIVIASGNVKVDGAVGQGLSVADARRILQEPPLSEHKYETRNVYNGYGCNMTVRLSTINDTHTRFDENLPLYGWLEDVDFSRQLAEYGRIVWCNRLQGVHLGSKKGRSPGRRLGYSQIANPWYLFRKRTMSARPALVQVSRNIASNVAHSFAPEPWVDRRGRLVGNLLGLLDLLRGRLHPRNITALG